MTEEQPTGEVILYRREDGAPAIEVCLDAETVWLSQQQIAELFQTSQQNVSLHLRNIYAEGELDEEATHKDFLLVRREGARDVRRALAHYNLDAIISAFAGEHPRKSDVVVAKNSLDETELKKPNIQVPAYFDAAEFRAQNHEPTYMKDWLAHLDRLITAMDAPTLTGAGTVSHQQAVAKAEGEYEKYRTQLDAQPSSVEEAYLERLKRAQKEVEGNR